MLQTIADIKEKFGLTVYGVIHIGAHRGQEYLEYLEGGVYNMIFFEPEPNNYEILVDNLKGAVGNLKFFNLALGNETGIKEMFIETANQGMSSSILKPKEHLKQYPWITFDYKQEVLIDRLDNILFNRSDYNMINIDVQGYELEVFKGAMETLESINIIYTEVNAKEMYEGCVLVKELDEYLRKFGFNRVVDNLGKQNWGEAIYLK